MAILFQATKLEGHPEKQFRLQTAFDAGTHQRDLSPEPANYRKLEGHPLEKQFCKNMEDPMREYCKQFKSWNTDSSQEAKGHQVLGCQLDSSSVAISSVTTLTDQGYNPGHNILARPVGCGRQIRPGDVAA